MNNYLIHYGILGQKWGVRRYQNEDGTLTAAGRQRYGIGDPRKAKYNFVDRSAVKLRAIGRTISGSVRESIKSARNKDAKAAASYLVRHKGNALAYREAGKAWEDIEKHARTKIGTKYAKASKLNARAMAAYNDLAYNRDLGEHIVSKYFDIDAWNTPYYRISGRKTTRGREIVNQVFTLGIAGQVMDYKYWKDQKEIQPIKKKTENA